MAQRPKPFLALISRLRYLLLKGPEVGDSWPKTENKQKTPVLSVQQSKHYNFEQNVSKDAWNNICSVDFY